MMSVVPLIVDFIRGNVPKHGEPLGIGREALTARLRRESPPGGDKFHTFTGLEYQIILHASTLIRLASAKWDLIIGGSGSPSKLDLTVAKLKPTDKSHYESVPVSYAQGSIWRITPKADVYPGALLYEFGSEEDSGEYARGVTRMLRDDVESFQIAFPEPSRASTGRKFDELGTRASKFVIPCPFCLSGLREVALISPRRQFAIYPRLSWRR